MARKAIGLTGPFGSGCTTAARNLLADRGARHVRLSQVLRDLWRERHPNQEPSRSDLQRLGDEVRQGGNLGLLVERALEGVNDDLVVVDSIRNLGEIDKLREIFGYNFTLVAILASPAARWQRIRVVEYLEKGRTQQDFLDDDQRDQDEETPWGQQVALCMDAADIFINNDVAVTVDEFYRKLLAHVDLATGRASRQATQTEIYMNIAYSSSHSSKCLKRRVGAVIIDADGQVVSAGYNENPLTTNPCVEEVEYNYKCYRDIVRNETFKRLSETGARCPQCGSPLTPIQGPPWECPSCRDAGGKTNLESFYFPDRAMNWCTAVHAELWAILAAGFRARRGTLYTTTFPCFQCAEKITQAGINKVIFTEAYPDVRAAKRLEMGRIEVTRFEGVRSMSFERIFGRNRPR